MRNIIHFEPLTPSKHQTYIDVGTRAYNQHYAHLWINENAEPYIKNNFSQEVLQKEENDDNTLLYLIALNKTVVGIFKIILNRAIANYSAKDTLYLDKIYILTAYSGKGIGQKVMQFIGLRAKEMDKKLIWLGSMQKSPALNFYLKNGFEIHSETKVPFAAVKEAESAMYILIKKVAR